MSDDAQTAAELIGPLDDYIFLSRAETVVPLDLAETWERLESDRHESILRALSDRFIERQVLDELPDGYACATLSRRSWGRRPNGFMSIVQLRRHGMSIERQIGDRTDLLCITDYGAQPGGTQVTYSHSVLAKTARFGTGQMLEMQRRRSDEVVASRIEVIDRLCRE